MKTLGETGGDHPLSHSRSMYVYCFSYRAIVVTNYRHTPHIISKLSNDQTDRYRNHARRQLDRDHERRNDLAFLAG